MENGQFGLLGAHVRMRMELGILLEPDNATTLHRQMGGYSAPALMLNTPNVARLQVALVCFLFVLSW